MRRWFDCSNARRLRRTTAGRVAKATRPAMLSRVVLPYLYFEARRAPAALASASVMNLPFLVVPYSLSPEPW